MKAIIFAISLIFSVASARVVITADGQHAPPLLGAKACTWGPGYWCMNITNAAGCKATSHCIKNVWSTMHVPEDNDSVCDICKDMVTQARDQLESNQTQEDLKAVFEGSCKLMMIDQVVRECDRLVDQFIPELVETLASQMNPSVVCSVAGLCNSARIDQLLVEHEAMLKKINAKVIPQIVSLENDELKPDNCTKCYTIAKHMEKKLSNTPKDQMAQEFVNICGNFDSFSDACSSIVLVYFDTIYSHLRDNFKANNICHLSGQCSGKFHKHEDDGDKEPEVEIRPLSSVGMVEVGDDLPCKLCEQLVGHLRDLLVANTTEVEFQQVLHGLCKQTKSFASECLSLVDQYYPEIYEYLVHGLNSNAVCEMGGICPAPGKNVYDGMIMPLIPLEAHKIGVRIMNEHKQKNLGMNGAGQRKVITTEADEMQLPIERFQPIFGSLALPNMDVKGQETCAFCEYVVHYLQEVITNPKNVVEMKDALEKVCDKLPGGVVGTCNEFVETYGDALVAIFAQEIDPTVVCPMMHVCPSQQAMDAWEAIPKSMMIKSNVEEKPSCPLCLLAVTQVYQVIKNNRTEENIVKELDQLCSHLPKSLNNQCVDFVNDYSKELIKMLLDDLEPQEVCAYLKLCDASKNVGAPNLFPLDKDGEIMTNEIPNFPIHQVKKVETDTKCTVCELIMQYVEKAMKNRSTKDEIEEIVHGACNYLPGKYSTECNDFVDEYAEIVIDLLSKEVSPREICTLIGFCDANIQRLLDSVAECALCQAIVSSIDTMLTDPNFDHKIEELVGQACDLVPASKRNKCSMMLKVYEQSIINLLKSGVDTKKICKEMSLCSSGDLFAMSNEHFRNRRADELNPAKQCTWGIDHVCGDLNLAKLCNMDDYCKKNIWKDNAPDTPMEIGTEEERSS